MCRHASECKLCLPRPFVSSPLLSFIPRPFHNRHCLFLRILEHFYTFGVSRCIDQMKVCSIFCGMKDDGRTCEPNAPTRFTLSL